MRGKKLLSILLACIMMLALVPTVAFAEGGESVAEINGNRYNDVKSAIDAAKDGDTIVILCNCSVTSTLAVEKQITIDLNGKTITRNQTGYATAGIFRPRNGGKLTITDTSKEKNGMLHAIADSDGWAAPIWVKPGGEVIIKGGKIKGENGGKSTYALYIEGTKDNPAKATMKGGNLIAVSDNKNSYTVSLHGDNSTKDAAFFTMQGGKIESDFVAVNGNGLESGTTIVIEGGEINGGEIGIYHPQVGDITIKGGSITGVGSGIGIKAGNLTMTGGTVKATGEKATPESHNSGMNPSGAAIQIESHDGYGVISDTKHKMNITISGGDIISEKGCSVYEYLASNEGTESNCAIERLEISEGDFKGEVTLSDGINNGRKVAAISGGTFANKPNEAYLVNGFEIVQYGNEYKAVPLGSIQAPAEIPQTGDDNSILLYGALMLLALAGMMGTTVIGKRKRV